MNLRLKRTLLYVSVMSIFSLSGCTKYLMNLSERSFNEKYSITEPSTDTDTQTLDTSPSSGTTSTEANDYVSVRYEQLTTAQKVTYDEIYAGIESYSSDIYISQKVYQDDLEKVYDAIINTAPLELISTTRKYDYKYNSITGEITKVKPSYSVTLEERNRMEEEVKAVADRIVTSVEGLNTFETLKTFHDYIITHCDYEKSGGNYSNAYGALVEGKAVCEGYSRAFKYLCDMVNIPCELVFGTAEISHMWNLVRIDGQWYHIDVTWDDPENKGGDYVGYGYFNVSDSQISITHTIEDISEVPSATATDMNYYKYYGLCAYTSEELYNLIYGEVYNACLNGNKYVYVSMDDTVTFSSTLEVLKQDGWYVMYNIVKNAYSLAETSKKPSDVTFSYDANMLTITITLN